MVKIAPTVTPSNSERVITVLRLKESVAIQVVVAGAMVHSF